MSELLCLLPSPLLGPAVWEPVADTLRPEGWDVLVAASAASVPRSPEDVTNTLLSELPGDRELVLVPHSNAGLYVPAVADQRTVVATVFVDAGIPPASGAVPVTPTHLYDILAALADDDGLLPPWTQWWDEHEVAGLFPDAATRQAVEREQQRLPLGYFAESIPVPTGWDGIPAGAVLFGDTYAAERERAQSLGWPVRTLQGGHLHMLVDPQEVAGAITDLLAALGATRRH